MIGLGARKRGAEPEGEGQCLVGRYVKIAPVTYDRLLLSDASGLKNVVSATDTITTHIAVQAKANHDCLPLFS